MSVFTTSNTVLHQFGTNDPSPAYSVVYNRNDDYHIAFFFTREEAHDHLNGGVVMNCSRALFSPTKKMLESYFFDEEGHDDIISYFNIAVAQAQAKETKMVDLDRQTQIELEAAAFRKLTGHLLKRSDVQNIDIMILSGFCRNCLGKWIISAAKDKGIDILSDDAREYVYGMPFNEWKKQYMKPASAEQLTAMEKVMADPSLTTI